MHVLYISSFTLISWTFFLIIIVDMLFLYVKGSRKGRSGKFLFGV